MMTLKRCAMLGAALLTVLMSATQGATEELQIHLELTPVASGFKDPVHIAFPPGPEGVMAVAEEEGQVFFILGGDRSSVQPFLDIQDRLLMVEQRQLRNIAFHPKFNTNGKVYVTYSRLREEAMSFVLAEYHYDSEEAAVKHSATREILVQRQDEPEVRGGGLAFAGDGLLFVGLGDGGGKHDPKNHAQNPRRLFGKILRLNVDEGEPYLPPLDNPFVLNDRGLREIYALGFRDPASISVDRETSELWVGDRGEDTYEEVSLVKPGSNHGWSKYEGSLCLRMRFDCQDDSLSVPTVAYPHRFGSKVTVGFRYRGRLYPELAGLLIYADQTSGRIWALRMNGDAPVVSTELRKTDLQISAFAEDHAGELFLADKKSGVIFRLAASGQKSLQHAVPKESTTPADPVPQKEVRKVGE